MVTRSIRAASRRPRRWRRTRRIASIAARPRLLARLAPLHLNGEPEPDRAAKAGWLDRIRADTAAGRTWRRLRVVEPPLTDYVRYSCEWGYTDNTAAGEQVRVIDLSEAPTGAEVLVRLGDFYLLDDVQVAVMCYGPSGAFAGAEVVGEPLAGIYRAAARAAWAIAEPFDQWWPRHPEHHRSAAVP
jgi:hypothetical protein